MCLGKLWGSRSGRERSMSIPDRTYQSQLTMFQDVGTHVNLDHSALWQPPAHLHLSEAIAREHHGPGTCKHSMHDFTRSPVRALPGTKTLFDYEATLYRTRERAAFDSIRTQVPTRAISQRQSSRTRQPRSNYAPLVRAPDVAHHIC